MKINFAICIMMFLLLAVGCEDEYQQCTFTQTDAINVPTLEIPQIIKPIAPRTYSEQGWKPPTNVTEKRWNCIVVHHTATSFGSASIIDKWHREGNHWEGVGYDFVIGNGTSTPDGLVEPTFRWTQQRTGAHCKTPDNSVNERGIGICLIGNFDKTNPTPKQMQALAKLVKYLQKRYGIPKSRIYGHKDVRGANPTRCPGSKFSMYKLKSML